MNEPRVVVEVSVGDWTMGCSFGKVECKGEVRRWCRYFADIIADAYDREHPDMPSEIGEWTAE